MRKTLTPALHFAWATIFGFLGLGVLPGDTWLLSALLADPVASAALSAGSTGASDLAGFVLSLVCLSTAVLFAWALAISLGNVEIDMSGGEDVSRIAFATGSAALTLCLVAGVLTLVDGVFAVAMIALCALISSYIATFLERVSITLASEGSADDFSAATRLMALGAAHSSMLSKLSGRQPSREEERSR